MPKTKRVITLHQYPKTSESPNQKIEKPKVAAYARVSTNQADQLTSFIAQQRHYEQLIKSDDQMTFAGIYADEGKSGTTLNKRSEFGRLMTDCRTGKIDRILTKSISRFGRNVVDCLNSVRELKTLGIDVYFEKENIHTLEMQGELLLTIMSAMAESESWNLSDNVKWGIKRKYEQGHVQSIPSGKFLGYDKDDDGNLIIIEEEAAIVRRIYQEFLDGFGYYQISTRLTKDKILTEQGNDAWCCSTIKKILTNEKYKGDTLFLKTFNADPLTKRRVKNDGLRPQHYLKNTHPALIDEESWACVQLEFSRQAQFTKSHRLNVYHHHSEDLPLCGKVVCGTCGRVFGIRPNKDSVQAYWRCLGVKVPTNPKSCSKRLHLEKHVPERALVTAWNNLVENQCQIVIAPEDSILLQYRKRQLMELISEYGIIDAMPYQLMLKMLDHIRVEVDHLEVVFLAGITEKIAQADMPKIPHATKMCAERSRLARIRMERGLTRQQLAEMAGLAPRSLARIEAGKQMPSRERALKISEVLGVDWREWLDALPDFKEAKPPTRLKEIRIQCGFGQTQIARLVGMDRKYYCRIELGRIRPSPKMTQRINQALGARGEDWLDS